MAPSASQIKLGRSSRRSQRLALSVAVQVYGRDVFGVSFRELTRMHSVNAHGGMVGLASPVRAGQTILVANRHTGEEQEFRVVQLGPLKAGRWSVGIEFAHSPVNFWRVYFPPLTAKQRTRTRN